MNWRKLGLVYAPNGKSSWAQTHAMIPTPYFLNGETIRVYVAFWDKNKTGRIGYVDVSSKDPRHIFNISSEPCLDIGVKGNFDDSGVNPACVIRREDKLYLYYIGWQNRVDVRYTLFMGLAVSLDQGQSFQRIFNNPILPSSDSEKYVRTAGFVLDQGGSSHMCYAGGSDWIDINGKNVPTYNFKYISSKDGMHWPLTGQTCLKINTSAQEFGFGRPWIIFDSNSKIYKMWYSIRYKHCGYRLGYAESKDMMSWQRKDNQVGIDVSPTGWDSQMICFSSIFPTPYGVYMFYNGNNYGETGFGVAVLEEP